MEPRWFGEQQAVLLDIDPRIKREIFNIKSLTQRIESCCPTNFSVEVVSQKNGVPLLSEFRLLHTKFANIREVWLKCGKTKVIRARTVIPRASIKRGNLRLLRLGSRSLGAFLHANKNIHAHRPQIAKVNSSWARRTIYYSAVGNILVNEIFLPAYWQLVGVNL